MSYGTFKNWDTLVLADLGTINSYVGLWKNDNIDIITNDMGERTSPSYISFTDTERLVGDAA